MAKTPSQAEKLEQVRPKNRYGEKILSGDVNSTQDVNDLQFNNLVVGNYYSLTGYIKIDATAGSGELNAYGQASGAGDFYGKLAANENSDSPTQGAGQGASLSFEAKTTTLYVRYVTNSNENLLGDGTKKETFLQLEERSDLEKTSSFD